MKKFLLMLTIVLCFLCNNTASASRIDLTLGWHNLQNNGFYLIDANEGETVFELNDKIRTGLLDRSKLKDPGDISLAAFHFENDVDVWKLKTKKKFNKWIKKKKNKAIKTASKNQLRALNDSTKGWKDLYSEWKNLDIWTLYYGEDENEYIVDAFDNKFNGMKFKGKIGDQKFTAYLDIFANHYNEPETTPVPEPATIALFGMGLIGIAGLKRKYS